MVIAALITFAILFIAWIVAPTGRSTERPVVLAEEAAVPVTA
jgi:hypothetical protein